MKQIQLVIEKNADGYWAHSTNTEVLLTGYGESVDACKANVLACIETLRELDSENRFPYPEGDYTLHYQMEEGTPIS